MMWQTAILQALEEHITKALPEYIAIFGLFIVAAITSMPRPDLIEHWLGAYAPIPADAGFWLGVWQKYRDMLAILYRWMYDSLQTFMSTRRPTTLSSPPEAVPPVPVVTLVKASVVGEKDSGGVEESQNKILTGHSVAS